MAFRTVTETIDSMFVATWLKAIGGVRDQIFDSKKSALWAMLRQKDGMKSQKGGDYIKHNVQYDKNSNIYHVAKGEEIDLPDFEHLETVRYPWRRTVKPIVRFWADDQENQGEAQIVDYINSKINNTMESFKEEVDALLFGDNGTSSKIIHGLQHLVADDPTASRTVGEINQSTYSWWRNQTFNWSGTYAATDAAFLASGVSEMRSMINNSIIPSRGTDIIVTSWHIFELLQDEMLTYFNWDGKGPADLGALTNTLSFDGIPIMWSKNISNRMYFLNLDHIKYYYDPMDFMTLGPWLSLPKQAKDRVAHVTLAHQFTTDSRRAHGVIYNLPS